MPEDPVVAVDIELVLPTAAAWAPAGAATSRGSAGRRRTPVSAGAAGGAPSSGVAADAVATNVASAAGTSASSTGSGSAGRGRRRTIVLASAAGAAAGASGGGAAPRRRRGAGGGLFYARALLALPARAHARDLLVSEWAEMGANRHIHRAEEAHDLIGRICRTRLPCRALEAYSHRLLMSSLGARVHQRADALRQLPVHDPDSGRRVPSNRCAERTGTRSGDPANSPSRQQR